MSELVEHLFAVCPAAEALPRSLDRISDPPPPTTFSPAPPLTNIWRFLRAAGNSAARLSAETQTRRLTHSLKSDSERTECAQNALCLTAILVRPVMSTNSEPSGCSDLLCTVLCAVVLCVLCVLCAVALCVLYCSMYCCDVRLGAMLLFGGF